jgi:hypothetical protein
MEDENTERVERRYIGTFAIPFSTIYREGRIEGVFRLQTPVFNFGYDHNLHGIQKQKKEKAKMFVEEEFDDVDNDGMPLVSTRQGFFASAFRTVFGLFDSATAATAAAAALATARMRAMAETGDNAQLIHRDTQVLVL